MKVILRDIFHFKEFFERFNEWDNKLFKENNDFEL